MFYVCSSRHLTALEFILVERGMGMFLRFRALGLDTGVSIRGSFGTSS